MLRPRMAIYLKHISPLGPCHHALLIPLYCITAVRCIGWYQATIHHIGVTIWNTIMNFVSVALPSIYISASYTASCTCSHTHQFVPVSHQVNGLDWNLLVVLWSYPANIMYVKWYSDTFALSMPSYLRLNLFYGISYINGGIATVIF